MDDSEGFSGGSLPADITVSSAGTTGATVGVVSDYGNALPSLRGTGGGDWWYFTGARFQTAGDFDFNIDLNINPDGTGGTDRDIADLAFWVTPGATPATTANGFCFRLQVSNADHDGGFFKITNGVLTGPLTTGVTATSSLPLYQSGTPERVENVAAATWYRIHLVGTASTKTVTATLTRLSDSTLMWSGALDTTSYLDGSHATSGTFGQAKDGKGSSIGHRWDNALMSPGSGPQPARPLKVMTVLTRQTAVRASVR